jgi:hypothetical protein
MTEQDIVINRDDLLEGENTMTYTGTDKNTMADQMPAINGLPGHLVPPTERVSAVYSSMDEISIPYFNPWTLGRSRRAVSRFCHLAE